MAGRWKAGCRLGLLGMAMNGLAQAADPGPQDQEPVAPTVMVTASTQAASAFTEARPDAHAPAGIMGDHIHPRGEWMIGYHFMHVYQAGLMDGSDSVSKEHTYSSTANGGYGYHNAPRDMRMDMHMIEVMRGVTDRLTVMVMAQYISMAMKEDLHPQPTATLAVPEIPFTMNSNGIGIPRSRRYTGSRLPRGISVPCSTLRSACRLAASPRKTRCRMAQVV